MVIWNKWLGTVLTYTRSVITIIGLEFFSSHPQKTMNAYCYLSTGSDALWERKK